MIKQQNGKGGNGVEMATEFITIKLDVPTFRYMRSYLDRVLVHMDLQRRRKLPVGTNPKQYSILLESFKTYNEGAPHPTAKEFRAFGYQSEAQEREFGNKQWLCENGDWVWVSHVAFVDAPNPEFANSSFRVASPLVKWLADGLPSVSVQARKATPRQFGNRVM